MYVEKPTPFEPKWPGSLKLLFRLGCQGGVLGGNLCRRQCIYTSCIYLWSELSVNGAHFLKVVIPKYIINKMLHISILSGAQNYLTELQNFNILVVLVCLFFFFDPGSIDFFQREVWLVCPNSSQFFFIFKYSEYSSNWSTI